MPTTPPTINLPQPHPAQTKILNTPARYRVVACGRRFGKTELGKMAIVRMVLRGGNCWWLAPTYQVASYVWRDLRDLFAPMALEVNNSEHRILTKYGSVEVRSTHTADHLRGAGLDFAVLDEAAYMPAEVWASVVRPMLLERRGAALFLSTPYGRNWFYEVFQRGQDPLHPEWRSFHFPSSANPIVLPEELAQIQAETPSHTFQTEYEAQFLDDAGAVFRGIREVVDYDLPAPPQDGHTYVMGVDWGRDHDFTALAVLDASVKPARLVALERFQQVGYHLQRERLKVLADRYRVRTIWAEANSMGTVNIEELQRDGLPVYAFNTTARSKAPLIDALAVAIERGDVRLPNDPVLLNELASYTLERTPSGGVRYSAPAGGHDDTVIALALAWYAVNTGNILIAFV